MSTPIKSDDGAAGADNKPCPQPSLAEAYFFLNIIKFNKSKLDTEWDKVAEASGFKNAETAKVRFGQIKKKLGFQTGTPVAARVKPGKRGADTDEAGGATTPAEKKPRRAPAKSRAKKQPAGSSAPASSPTATEDESPLATKSAKKACQNIAPISSGLSDGNSYSLSAADSSGNGYAPSPLGTVGNGNGTTHTTKHNDGKMKTGHALKTIIKPEHFDADAEEEEENARGKAELFKMITQNQIRSEPEDVTEAKQHQAYDNRAFGPPNNFPHVNMYAPLDAKQVQATAQHARTPLPTSARQVRNAVAQQAMAAADEALATTASTASLRQAHTGGGQVTTIQARHQAVTAAQPVGGQQVAQEVEVVDDMALGADGLPGGDDDDDISAFHAVMYGSGGNGGIFPWPSN